MAPWAIEQREVVRGSPAKTLCASVLKSHHSHVGKGHFLRQGAHYSNESRGGFAASAFADENLDRKSDIAFPAGLCLNYGEAMWYNFLRNEWRHFLTDKNVFGNIMENRYGCR